MKKLYSSVAVSIILLVTYCYAITLEGEYNIRSAHLAVPNVLQHVCEKDFININYA